MTTIPRFGSVDLNGDGIPTDAKKQFDDHFHQVGHSAGWQTPEHILVPPLFGSDDLEGLDFLATRPGIATSLTDLASQLSQDVEGATLDLGVDL